MPTDYNTETNLSKDELVEILNEIDTERQRDSKDIKENHRENTPYQAYPNPGNPFY